ncbi:MAG: carboxypeptidase regulatory-like domain-containing protein, partial [Bacteroidia bacterium]|nr:carboxypeptidase regulatory-like domain-containing protein [Bacteroidia bacterium]
MKNRFTTTFILLLISGLAFAQTAEMRGSLFDAETGEPLVGADVLMSREGEPVYFSAVDEDGHFSIPDIYPGKYVFKVAYTNGFVYNEEVNLSPGVILTRFKLKVRTTGQGGSDTLGTADIIRRGVPSENTKTVDVKEIGKYNPEIKAIVDLNPNIRMQNGRPEVGPTRSGGTQYYLGGANATIGRNPLVLTGLSGAEIIDVSVPARYGNFTGGGIQYIYSPIGVKPVTSIQLQTTSPFNGYHHNLGVLYLERALKIRELEVRGRPIRKTVFGYSLLGTYKYQADPLPSNVTPMVISDEALANIYGNPLLPSEVVGGYVPASAFLREQDLESQTARPNAHRHDAEGRLKLSYNPTDNLTIDFINSLSYLNRRLSQANNVLMNSDENPRQTYSFFNSQVQIKHKVKSFYDAHGRKIQEDTGLISRLSYTIDLNFQQTNSEVASARHGDNFFNYGHVGQFETVQVAQYNYVEDGETPFIDEHGNERVLTHYTELTGYRDSLVHFIPGKSNPGLADYTSFFYNQNSADGSIQNLVSRGGLLNGYNMPLLYSLYANPGAVYGTYSKSFQKRFNITANTEFSLHPFRNNRKIQHDFEVGLMFQQDVSGYYSLNAGQLWQLMPLLANSHIQNVDRSNPIFSTDATGRFTDTISYPVFVDVENQKTFDRNLRQKLMDMGHQDINGNPITESSRIDVNSLSPEVFDL